MKPLAFFAGLFLLASGTLPSRATVAFYAVSNDGVERNNLLQFDSDLASFSTVGIVPDDGGTTTLWELVVSPGGNLYAIVRETDTLYTLRSSDAAVLSTVTLDSDMFTFSGRGFAGAPDGTLYGIFGGDNLRSIDPLSGTTTDVVTITGAVFEALAFGSDGVLYGAGSPAGGPSSRLYTIDITSGSASFIGVFDASLPDVDTLTFGPDGFLYGVDTTTVAGTDLFRINPQNASAVRVGGIPGGVNGIAAIIPEPSRAVLLILGACGVAFHRRRG